MLSPNVQAGIYYSPLYLFLFLLD